MNMLQAGKENGFEITVQWNHYLMFINLWF